MATAAFTESRIEVRARFAQSCIQVRAGLTESRIEVRARFAESCIHVRAGLTESRIEVRARFAESCIHVRAGSVESWIGVVKLGVSMTRIHDSAKGAGPTLPGGSRWVVGWVRGEVGGK